MHYFIRLIPNPTPPPKKVGLTTIEDFAVRKVYAEYYQYRES